MFWDMPRKVPKKASWNSLQFHHISLLPVFCIAPAGTIVEDTALFAHSGERRIRVRSE
jgi:hypothetical protein